ncbi:MAG TPA: YdcF family protein [Patescibacteria group bacterium]|nr:YdcF family protein [Patescibacteria group bacterium]
MTKQNSVFKKIKKVLAIVMLCSLGLVILDATVVFGFALSEKAPEHADTLMVFGAKPYSVAMRQRTLHGIGLYQQGMAKHIVFTGGKTHIKFAPEAEVMKNIAVVQGFDADVIIESESYNSYENLKFTKQKIGIPDSVLFVSDCYHLGRLYLMALRLGYHDISYSCPASSYYPPKELAYYYLREIVAMVWYLPKFAFG